MGLDPAKHLGKELASLNAYLHKLKEYVKYVQHSFSLCIYIGSLKYVDWHYSMVFLHINEFCVPLFDRSYGINVCGEGGEYETLTLDCPLFIVSSYHHWCG